MSTDGSPLSRRANTFRNNVWWWHPLWDYCLEVSEVARKVKYGHSKIVKTPEVERVVLDGSPLLTKGDGKWATQGFR